MREAAQIETENVRSSSGGGVFYKCPIGGFASLRPGYCPKCHESLTPVSTSSASATSREESRKPGALQISVGADAIPGLRDSSRLVAEADDVLTGVKDSWHFGQ